MGVPKFYRWISERYPCLSEVVKEFQLPEFDNLYLDMNGIVHVCSHPEDDNPHFRITEEQIFKDICHYIEFLFRMIKPRKVFFMAIDGVAPRAKMNQQRGRRFRSAREAEELIKQALEKGEELPTEKRFDSNCITPGTPFMKRLQDHLKYFVVNKVTHDPLWQGPKIILSGHETPGEGEHKVMDFIRYSRSQPDHDPNTRHCLYGLDADLIMLGLTSHEPHFALLREEVRFGGGKKNNNKRPATPEETTFHLLHLCLMREYLDYEFSALKDTLPFDYNLENVIDDWIMMGFLVGNDFIPHLPHLHIHHDALPLLWKTYIDILPTLDGYLNEGGHLNLRRFEKYMGALAQFDRDQFSDQFLDMKFLEGKKGLGKGAQGGAQNGPSRRKKTGGDSAFAALEGLDDMDLEYDGEENGLLEAHLKSQGLDTCALDSDEDFNTFDAEFSAHKRDYYMTKLKFENVTPEVLRNQAYEYVRAIQWILLYYYEGVQSWSWFFPHHYAPYISDIRDFSNMDIRFEMSAPFRPFEQLMAVLPAASKELLPEPLQELMTSEFSPVLDYYPVKFESDLNGKQQDWEAVVLIPFIDENRLLAAMRTREHLLTPEERRRNSHGPCYMYQYSSELQGPYPSSVPGVFPDLVVNHAKVCDIPKFHFCLAPERIRKGLLEDVLLDVYFPGFPSLKHIPHHHRLDKCGVKVFQMNSRGYNMMLHIDDLPEKSLEHIAAELLGQTTWVGWPHLHEAKVYAVADERFRIEIEEHHKKGQSTPIVQWKRRELHKGELERVYKEASSIKEKYHDRFGVEVGKTTVLIYAGPMTGQKYVYISHGRITAEKQFSTNHTAYALQATCKDILTHVPDNMQLRTMDELFPKDASVFMLGNPHYGCQGEVVEVDNQEGRVRVSFNVLQEPDLSLVYQGQQMFELDHFLFCHSYSYFDVFSTGDMLEDQQYMPGYIAAQRLGLNNHMLSRITGTILILRGDGGNTESRANIGLNLKFTKRGEEVPGYTKKTDEGWLYSQKCVQTISNYLNEFADLWDYIATSQTGNSDIYTEVELFPEESEKKLKDVLKYLEELPCAKVRCMKSGANILGDTVIQAIELETDRITEVNKKRQKKVKILVKPHLLFRPLPNQGTLEPDPGTTFEMLDRVVVVKMGYSVPFGLRGTIVGIHPGEREADTVYEIIFDQEFVGGIVVRGSTKRGYRVPGVAMLNLTHGEAKKHGGRQQQKQQQRQITGAPPSWNAWQQQQPQSRPGFGYQGNMQSGQGQGSYSMLMHQDGAPQGPGVYGMMPPRTDQQTRYSFPSQILPRPQFAAPKFPTSPPKAARGPPVSQPGFGATDNGDFTSIWNQLLQSNMAAGGAAVSKMPQPSIAAGSPVVNKTSLSSSTAGSAAASKTHQAITIAKKDSGTSGSSSSPIFGGSSLQSAAEKLGKICLPTTDLMEIGFSDNPPTGILVDLSESGEGTAPHRLGNPAMKQAPQERNQPSHEQETKKTKTRIFTNSSHNRPKLEEERSSSASKNNTSVLELFEKASKVREDPVKSMPQPGQTDKVQALFDQVQKPTSMSHDSASVSSEFSSLFAALQAAPKSVSPANQGASPQPSTEDGSAALKQMLKIGMEETPSTEQSNKKSYGKQVSVQELFDVAKQVPPSSQPETSTESQPVSAAPPSSSSMQQGIKTYSDHQLQQQQQQRQLQLQQQQQQQQHQLHRQQFVQPVHPSQPMSAALLPPPALLGNTPTKGRNANRKPVEELAALCQGMNKPLPKYDINYQGKQKGFISMVTLPGGARFEGSLSLSQGDAVESAASMALLCLRQAQMGFPGQRGTPWMQRGGPGIGVLRPGQPLFSPNSAFSPVANPMMRFGPPMFSQPPPSLLLSQGQRGRQPLLSQPPPPFIPNRGPHPMPSAQLQPMVSVPFSQQPLGQSHPSHPPPHTHTTSEPRHPLADVATTLSKEVAGSQVSVNQSAEEKWKEVPVTMKSSTEAFIPLQVTRKQRRKEETPEKQAPSSTTRDTVDGQHQPTVTLIPVSEKKASSQSPSVHEFSSNNAPDSASHSASHSHRASEDKSSPRNNISSDGGTGKLSAREEGSLGSGKKRRPRIVANFNLDLK